MRNKRWHYAIAALSSVILILIGLIGEVLLTIAVAKARDLGWDGNASGLPAPTRVVMTLFPAHSGYFVFSITPFILMLFAIVAVPRELGDRHWLRFAIIWLTAMLYVTTVGYALLIPFDHTLEVTGSPRAWYMILIADLLIGLLCIRWCIRARKERGPTCAWS